MPSVLQNMNSHLPWSNVEVEVEDEEDAADVMVANVVVFSVSGLEDVDETEGIAAAGLSDEEEEVASLDEVSGFLVMNTVLPVTNTVLLTVRMVTVWVSL